MSSPSKVLDTSPVAETRKLYSLRARSKWVLIKMIPKDERRTSGGIVVSAAQAKTQHGLVIDVDSSQVPDLHPGDVVVFTNFPNDLDDVEELTGQRDLYLVRDEEVYARAEEITDMGVLAQMHAEAKARLDAMITEASKKYDEGTTKQ